MRLYLTTPPTVQPLGWDDGVSTHLRVDSDEERSLVEGIYIPAVVDWVEAATNRALMTQTWQMHLDTFPGRGFYPTAGPLNSNFGPIWFTNFGAGIIRIPRPNLVTVNFIRYVDTDGVLQTWDPSNYVVDAPIGSKASAGRIWPAYGIVWPITRGQRDAVLIEFVAGYGTTTASVPGGILQAMLLLIAEMYERRETGNEISISDVPISAMNMLSQYMVEA